jgi:RNA polymerase primary sigma factor
MSKSAPVEERFPAVRQLIELGRDKGYLLYDEIYDLLPDEVASLPDELDDIYVRFGEQGIEIIDRPDRYRNREDLDTGETFEKPGGEVAEFGVTEQEKTNDPVRMYLREMGTVPLLDRDGEVEIAQRIEQGEWMIYEALKRPWMRRLSSASRPTSGSSSVSTRTMAPSRSCVSSRSV